MGERDEECVDRRVVLWSAVRGVVRSVGRDVMMSVVRVLETSVVKYTQKYLRCGKYVTLGKYVSKYA